MYRKAVMLAMVVLFIPFLVCAADTDKAFFEGVWVGNWIGFTDTSIQQEATVKIGPEIGDGVFKVVYKTGEAVYRSKTVPAGKIKTEGSVKDDAFRFSWKSKKGRTFDMILKKESDTTVKARLERSGPLDPMERPYSETTLKRQ